MLPAASLVDAVGVQNLNIQIILVKFSLERDTYCVKLSLIIIHYLIIKVHLFFAGLINKVNI